MSEGICLVTGATSGIGFATAREIALRGFTVIIVGRSLERSEAAVNQIKEATLDARVDFLLADLSVQSEVRRLEGIPARGHPGLDDHRHAAPRRAVRRAPRRLRRKLGPFIRPMNEAAARQAISLGLLKAQSFHDRMDGAMVARHAPVRQAPMDGAEIGFARR
jgi:NAD(P)-dependent dehydrogenase (short-subunit alcohol dehydrogenase family)